MRERKKIQKQTNTNNNNKHKQKQKNLLDAITFQTVLYYVFGEINLYNLVSRPKKSQFCQMFLIMSGLNT